MSPVLGGPDVDASRGRDPRFLLAPRFHTTTSGVIVTPPRARRSHPKALVATTPRVVARWQLLTYASSRRRWADGPTLGFVIQEKMGEDSVRGTATLAIVLAALAAIAALGMGSLGMMGPGMMGGYGFPTGAAAGGWAGAMALGWLMMVAFLGAIMVGLVFLVRWAVSATEPAGRTNDGELPLAILKRRYAAGEIDEATYERMKRELAA